MNKPFNIAARNLPALAATLLLTLAAGCNNDSLTDSQLQDPAGKQVTITATLSDDNDQPQTRLEHESGTGTNPGVAVKWIVGDDFKLFTGTGGITGGTDPNTVTTFTIDKATDITNNGKTASFSGTLTTGATGKGYAIYPAAAAKKLPGSMGMDSELNATKWAAITLSMGGQKQTGNDNYTHTPTFDYMTAEVTDVTTLTGNGAGTNSLVFNHLVGMMTIKITTAPTGYTAAADGSNAPVMLTLTADMSDATKQKNFNASLVPSTGAVTPGSIALALDGITWGTNGFTAHLMMLPTDLTGQTFIVSIKCKNGDVYNYTTPQVGKAYVAGKRYTATLSSGTWVKVEAPTPTETSKIFDATTAAATGFANSSDTDAGSITNPYRITNAAELKFMVDQVNINDNEADNNGNNDPNTFDGKFIRLDTDIRIADGTEWIPIGFGNRGFRGNFDGNGHTIYGKMGNSDTKKYSRFGFFGYLNTNAIVSNLNIDAEVTSSYNDGSSSYIGGLAGTTYKASISGCSFRGKVTMSNESNGNSIAGLVGQLQSSTLSGCFVRADVAGISNKTSNSYVALVAARVVNSYISSCTTYGSVKAGSSSKDVNDNYAGSIAGYVGNTSGEEIKLCTNYATITGGATGNLGNCYTGGIVGEIFAGIFSGCTNKGTVAGGVSEKYNYTGGIAGQIYDGTLHTCINEAAVTGGTGNDVRTGGLVGNKGGTGIIYDCCNNTGTVDGNAASSTSGSDNRVGNSTDGSAITICPGHTAP